LSYSRRGSIRMALLFFRMLVDELNTFTDPTHDRNGHAVADRRISLRVTAILLGPAFVRDLGPTGREALELLAFLRGEPANRMGRYSHMRILVSGIAGKGREHFEGWIATALPAKVARLERQRRHAHLVRSAPIVAGRL